jgi:hypothetical protein
MDTQRTPPGVVSIAEDWMAEPDFDASVAAEPDDALRRAVRDVLDDFARRVLHAHDYSEVDSHRDELTELIVGILEARDARDDSGDSPRRASP